ncbi:hypothetical protein EK21DRAFT_118993 [Setomelanomma holmii]|uniref:Uncharacterized protein n=1 Tax=Setomelanomma holmii TaxID=210430 RepID=A0A9P4LFH0_9PLEO|nr:hypothetical protein EK21DRAFT_118993 [Setomelanomma holmii]
MKVTADRRTDIALTIRDYALRNGLLREYSCEELEFADGSLEYTSGFGDVTLAIRNPGTFDAKWTTKTVRFHVLKNLHFNVDFEIFRSGVGSVLQVAASLGPIAHLRTLEQSVPGTPDPPPIDGQSIKYMMSTDIKAEIQALDQKELHRRTELRKKKSYIMAEAEHHTQKQSQDKAERLSLVNELQSLFTA